MTNFNQVQRSIHKDTIGLVLCGGNSSRMGADKSMLQYYDKPQRYHVYDMLTPLCDQVYISVNDSQADNTDEGYHVLADLPQYHNTGPMAALLTAFTKFPKKNILLVGCDYPFLSTSDLINFAACCTDVAAAFYNEAEHLFEPLLAWYPSRLFTTLKDMYAENDHSLQHLLKEGQTVKYYAADKHSIISVDTHEAFITARKLISRVW